MHLFPELQYDECPRTLLHHVLSNNQLPAGLDILPSGAAHTDYHGPSLAVSAKVLIIRFHSKLGARVAGSK